MNKYRNNNSKGAMVGLGAGGIVVVLVELFHVIHGINQISKVEQRNPFQNAPVYIITTDSNGKRDSQLLQDYMNKKTADTIKTTQWP